MLNKMRPIMAFYACIHHPRNKLIGKNGKELNDPFLISYYYHLEVRIFLQAKPFATDVIGLHCMHAAILYRSI